MLALILHRVMMRTLYNGVVGKQKGGVENHQACMELPTELYSTTFTSQ